MPCFEITIVTQTAAVGDEGFLHWRMPGLPGNNRGHIHKAEAHLHAAHIGLKLTLQKHERIGDPRISKLYFGDDYGQRPLSASPL
jgi:hypothetical protein